MRSHSICGRARALYHGLSSFYATADRLSVPESQNVSTIKHLSRSGRDFPLPAGVLRVVSGTLCHQLARPRAQAWSPSKLYSITSDGLHQVCNIFCHHLTFLFHIPGCKGVRSRFPIPAFPPSPDTAHTKPQSNLKKRSRHASSGDP
ncbi:hypothetical protein HBI81_161220 [Parastagonospora nodorum]|nr:hypothetical protein HBH46_025400 [Parastagonospora nodorum]KAH4167322.1 hypothetical protein HBH43_126780 [Parastagonospora nodorum]KAH4457649.1 hypothetical protein HBH91_084690 [Parastagonospora nodorum]KAH4511126.1 hypothetical protein HBH89_043920 [Parastagonospora nodorum]KAH4920680.1 hypothetical protein HBI79_194460 [Parastagonospora nodorum]